MEKAENSWRKGYPMKTDCNYTSAMTRRLRKELTIWGTCMISVSPKTISNQQKSRCGFPMFLLWNPQRSAKIFKITATKVLLSPNKHWSVRPKDTMSRPPGRYENKNAFCQGTKWFRLHQRMTNHIACRITKRQLFDSLINHMTSFNNYSPVLSKMWWPADK